MNGRSWIDERCEQSALFEAQVVFDRQLRTFWKPVGEDVGADLSQGRLKEDEGAVVGVSARGPTQQLHRVVEDVQSLVDHGEGGAELKGLLCGSQAQKPARASSTVA